MKLFLLGIDGGDWNVFDQFEMPFLKQLRGKSHDVKLHEDLHSRGWVEIISGSHASRNNGYYYRPKLDGTTDFTYSFTFDQLKRNSSDPLIWEIPGVDRVGVMNVPTTYPAPKIKNGFFVSGAGGGLTKVEGVPSEMCSGEATPEKLEAMNYVVDLRLVPSGITDTRQFFAELTSMMNKRFNAFCQLLEDNTCEFGFLVLRAPTVVTYAGMYEIVVKNNKLWQTELSKFFLALDKGVEKCFRKLSPSNFIITSDHGCVSQEYLINYNVILEQLGYLCYEKSLKDKISYNKGWLKVQVKKFLGRFYLPELDYGVDFSRTRIFGKSYFHGLYVNDVNRFGGPVKESEIKSEVDKFCLNFNATVFAKRYGLKARSHRSEYMQHEFSAAMPDIWVDCSDNIYHLGKGRKFVQKNPCYRTLGDNLPFRVSSMLTGSKGIVPICTINNELKPFVAEYSGTDLSLVYHLTKRVFEN